MHCSRRSERRRRDRWMRPKGPINETSIDGGPRVDRNAEPADEVLLPESVGRFQRKNRGKTVIGVDRGGVSGRIQSSTDVSNRSFLYLPYSLKGWQMEEGNGDTSGPATPEGGGSTGSAGGSPPAKTGGFRRPGAPGQRSGASKSRRDYAAAVRMPSTISQTRSTDWSMPTLDRFKTKS